MSNVGFFLPLSSLMRIKVYETDIKLKSVVATKTIHTFVHVESWELHLCNLFVKDGFLHCVTCCFSGCSIQTQSSMQIPDIVLISEAYIYIFILISQNKRHIFLLFFFFFFFCIPQLDLWGFTILGKTFAYVTVFLIQPLR